MNLEDTSSTVFATISGGRQRKACKTGVSSMLALCNCGRRSPSQSCSKGSIQRRDIGFTPGAVLCHPATMAECQRAAQWWTTRIRRSRAASSRRAEVGLCRFLVQRLLATGIRLGEVVGRHLRNGQLARRAEIQQFPSGASCGRSSRPGCSSQRDGDFSLIWIISELTTHLLEQIH